ncbi:MAG TPA: hypothetical protein VM429_07815, partial [Micropruina sp.]|nr:hypothetical protein [Micropruina sp.]
MTVTTGEARTVPVTCAPRWDGTETVIDVRPSWVPVAEKLVAVGRRRAELPLPSPQRREEREAQIREEIWDEIRRLWYDEAKKVAMTASIAMKLLGLSRQAFYNIVNHHVGVEAVHGPSGSPASKGVAYIRTWAEA